jgi:DnaJ family protein C protein 11
MRERATKHFNKILVAYETLTNPHKRIVYDKLGVEGLKDRTWQVGVKSMSPGQFKLWLERHMRKQRVEELEELVVSRGKVVTTLDISGLWYSQIMMRQGPDGSYVAEELQPPAGAMTSYLVNHSFEVPLEGLADVLESPLPSSIKELWQEKDTPPAKTPDVDRPKPTLSFDCSLGGAPMQRKFKPVEQRLPSSVLAQTALSATLVHSFPNLPPEAPRSVASLLAGNQIAIATTILPTPSVSTQFSRGFGQNAILTRATFIGLPSLQKAPIVECNFTRRLATRHSVFVGVNTGGTTWLANFYELFSLPQLGNVRNGFASMGYTYHPVGSAVEGSSEGDEKAGKSWASRSQRTESYTVSVTAGLLAQGMQAKFAWGRTFFVGTPLTTQHFQPSQRQNVGVRLGVEVTAHISGASSWTIKASRKIFEHTVIGVNATMGGHTGKGGVVLGLSWTRLGQRFSIPVILTPIPDTRFMLCATAAPFLVYVATEFLWLRRREEKLRERQAARMRKALHSKTLRRRKAAEEAAEVMRAGVERKMEAEKRTDGLVVLEATYGTTDGKFSADVTIAVAALVDQGQLVLPGGIEKSRIIGFYDPAPGSEKVLKVRYLFNGLMHDTTVKEKQALVAPLRSHRSNGSGNT